MTMRPPGVTLFGRTPLVWNVPPAYQTGCDL